MLQTACRTALLILTSFGLLLAAGLSQPGVRAHELWLEPEAWQVAPGDPIAAHVRNGQFFSGMSLSWFDTRVRRAERFQDGQGAVITGRMGDVPAVRTEDPEEGLAVLVYESDVSLLTYAEWAKFTHFVEEKGAAWVVEAHRARGLPETGIAEAYSRYAKALVAVGAGEGSDLATGMEVELVARANPYTDEVKAFPVDLIYRDAPLADHLVTVFDKAPDGTVDVATTRTDAAGRASFPVTVGHTYLVDAVVLREATSPEALERKAVWESLWAALTFHVPDT